MVSKSISMDGKWLKDELGRTVLLRGINLGGSTKVPTRPNGATWNKEGFYNHRDVSFVGRPFPLEEADEHLGRLRDWGFNFLRFLVTWEAIEHAGPGEYDEEYLDYVAAVIEKAGEYGFRVFIDPHQDVWSRFSGGDGAPGWTFDILGIDVSRLSAAKAAILHQEEGENYQRMVWPSNYSKFACGTLFTLFFGGQDFAPKTLIDGVNIQEFLQSHYINSMKEVAKRICHMPHVVGYDTMNEPSQGFIGYPVGARASRIVLNGFAPTILQGMWLAAGYPQKVKHTSSNPFSLHHIKSTMANTERVSVWKEGVEPVWKQNGVWGVHEDGSPHVIDPDHFAAIDGHGVDFYRDYFAPFAKRYAEELREVHPDALIFVTPQPPEFSYGTTGNCAPKDTEGIVYAPHWYDYLTLGFQMYLPWLGFDFHEGKARFALGRKARRRNFVHQMERHKQESEEWFGGVPVVIGETGIAMNLNGKKAYQTGDFSAQTQAMDDTLQAVEENFFHLALWNYTADNTNEHGDGWNGEDLSIFSRDQWNDNGSMYDGGRALDAVVRPYPMSIPGEPLQLSFDLGSRELVFEFRIDPVNKAPLVMFMPKLHYPSGYSIEGAHGRMEINLEEQRFFYHPDPAWETHRLRFRRPLLLRS